MSKSFDENISQSALGGFIGGAIGGAIGYAMRPKAGAAPQQSGPQKSWKERLAEWREEAGIFEGDGPGLSFGGVPEGYTPPPGVTVKEVYVVAPAKKASVPIVPNSYDITKAVNFLNSNALPGFGRGACSPFVPRAINAGFGFHKIPTNLAGGAYGPTLTKAGFSKLSVKSLNNYSPLKGDIAVMNGPPDSKRTCFSMGGGPCGHIQMFNGKSWVSDFVQPRPFWPGKDYQISKPSFEIFRWE